MPYIQLLGEDDDIKDAIAKFSAKRGYRCSHYSDLPDLLKVIPQSQASLIIITPRRDGRWNVVQAVAEVRSIPKHTPLILINKVFHIPIACSFILIKTDIIGLIIIPLYLYIFIHNIFPPQAWQCSGIVRKES